MREQLAQREGERRKYTGVFEKFSYRIGWIRNQDTVLLLNIRDERTGRIVTDHLWFNLTLGFIGLELKSGDIVEFEGRAAEYEKGYYDQRELDYKLANPTKLRKITQREPSLEPFIYAKT